MEKIIVFIKSNLWITAFFILSILIITSYILTTNLPELFDGAEELYNLFFQLSIGYTINFMFYITQIYIPNNKREAAIKNCISKRISQIESDMYKLLTPLIEIYSQGHCGKKYTDEELRRLENLRFSDTVKRAKVSTSATGEVVYYTVREWMTGSIYTVDDDIDCLFRYYATNISADLMEILEKIRQSYFHTTMQTLLANQKDTRLNQFACTCSTQYYQLIQELEEIHKKDYF